MIFLYYLQILFKKISYIIINKLFLCTKNNKNNKIKCENLWKYYWWFLIFRKINKSQKIKKYQENMKNIKKIQRGCK